MNVVPFINFLNDNIQVLFEENTRYFNLLIELSQRYSDLLQAKDTAGDDKEFVYGRVKFLMDKHIQLVKENKEKHKLALKKV